MKVFIHHKYHQIVIAQTAEQAAALLTKALAIHPARAIKMADMREVMMDEAKVVAL